MQLGEPGLSTGHENEKDPSKIGFTAGLSLSKAWMIRRVATGTNQLHTTLSSCTKRQQHEAQTVVALASTLCDRACVPTCDRACEPLHPPAACQGCLLQLAVFAASPQQELERQQQQQLQVQQRQVERRQQQGREDGSGSRLLEGQQQQQGGRQQQALDGQLQQLGSWTTDELQRVRQDYMGGLSTLNIVAGVPGRIKYATEYQVASRLPTS